MEMQQRRRHHDDDVPATGHHDLSEDASYASLSPQHQSNSERLAQKVAADRVPHTDEVRLLCLCAFCHFVKLDPRRLSFFHFCVAFLFFLLSNASVKMDSNRTQSRSSDDFDDELAEFADVAEDVEYYQESLPPHTGDSHRTPQRPPSSVGRATPETERRQSTTDAIESFASRLREADDEDVGYRPAARSSSPLNDLSQKLRQLNTQLEQSQARSHATEAGADRRSAKPEEQQQQERRHYGGLGSSPLAVARASANSPSSDVQEVQSRVNGAVAELQGAMVHVSGGCFPLFACTLQVVAASACACPSCLTRLPFAS